jgi:thiol-disulfide isomerase/thioredoxin
MTNSTISFRTPHSALHTCFCLLLVALAGCQHGAAPPPSKSLPTNEINIVTGDADMLKAMIAAHKGKVVFVDCWATWCGPCVQGFPHTVELANKYASQGLATISVSFDQLADQPRVLEFLTKQGAKFEHLLSKYDGVNQEAAINFNVEALPQYRLYDRQGKLRAEWEGQSDEIEPKIEELLAEQAT